MECNCRGRFSATATDGRLPDQASQCGTTPRSAQCPANALAVSPRAFAVAGGDSDSLGYSGFPAPRPGAGEDRSQAGDDGQPGLGLMRIDRDVDLGGLDGVHRPPLGETVAYLFLPDAARSPVTSLAVAEAEHVVMPADRHRGAKFFHEPRAVLVVPERVEEPAIEAYRGLT